MKKIIKRVLIYTIIIIFIVVIGYLFLKTPAKEEIKAEKYDIKLENENVVFPVKVMKVEKRTFIRWIKTNGIVKSNQEAEIIPQMSGRIMNSHIKEGMSVQKNDILLELDDREYKIALSRADNELMRAQFEYLVLKTGEDSNRQITKNDKITELNEKFLIAKAKYEKGEMDQDEYLNIRNKFELAVMATGEKRDIALQSRSGLLSAINEFKRAELNLSYTKIRAPFSGIIADFDLSVGGYVTPGKAICKIVDISTLKIIVGVLESDVRMLNIGRHVEINIPSVETSHATSLSNEFDNNKIIGTIIAISPIIDLEKKTCKVEIGLRNPPDHKIKPGMYANCLIEGEVLPNRLLIPRKALLVRNERKLIFTIDVETSHSAEGGSFPNDTASIRAKWCYVTTGVENEDWIEIIEGINIGDLLIIDGHYTLSHNASVKVEGGSAIAD